MVQDYTFIEGFVRLLASAIATAPSLPDALPKAQFLGAIAGPENTYFQRCFEALKVPESDRQAPTLSVTALRFQAIMAGAVQSGRYEQMLAVLVGAEWSYLAWASPYADRVEQLPFQYGEWIALHSGAYFESVVEHLREQLDRVWPQLDQNAQDRVATTFKQMIRLEREFFETAYAIP
ncbi:MAG: TenA family protein [Alphaproteobacteria bacterium]